MGNCLQRDLDKTKERGSITKLTGPLAYMPGKDEEKVELYRSAKHQTDDAPDSYISVETTNTNPKSIQEVNANTQNKNPSGPSKQLRGPQKVTIKFRVDARLFVPLRKASLQDIYTFSHLLGEGSQGTKVYEVIRKDSGAKMVLKIVPKISAVLSDNGTLFEEASILRSIDHPNILKLMEIYDDDASFYMVSEFLSGGELFAKLKDSAKFSETQAADYMKQIISAVMHLHDNKIIHRDIKAENFLLTTQNQTSSIKLIDFGVAIRSTPGEKIKKLIGNYVYIAPEILKKDYDERADIWSCGVLLYIMLCGFAPFKGNTNKEIATKIKAAEFSFEGEEWENVSEGAKDLIRKLLVVDPNQRISLQDAYNHDWIQTASTAQTIDAKCLQNLAEFNPLTSLQHSILCFIAHRIVSQNDKDEFMQTFNKLDKDGNGTLSKQELLEGYKAVFGDRKTSDEVAQIFETVDADKSGEIEFNEFVVASMSKNKLFSKSMLQTAFQYWDLDRSGFITKNEFKELMTGVELTEPQWAEVFAEIDNDNNGKITEKEFIATFSR